MDRLAVWLDSYRLGVKDALRAAARQGYHRIQISALNPELDPAVLSQSGRRHLAKHLRDLGLELDAVAAPFAGQGLGEPQLAERRLDQFRETLAMCRDLGVRDAAVNLPGAAQDGSVAAAMLPMVADLADRTGVRISIDDRSDSPRDLALKLKALDCRGVRLALDSGRGLQQTPLIAEFAGQVGAAYLRDVRQIGENPEEVPFGAGVVNFAEWIATLEAGGFQQTYVIRRDSQTSGVDALLQGREHIRRFLTTG